MGAHMACRHRGLDVEDIPIYGHMTMCYPHIWSYDHVACRHRGLDVEDILVVVLHGRRGPRAGHGEVLKAVGLAGTLRVTHHLTSRVAIHCHGSAWTSEA